MNGRSSLGTVPPRGLGTLAASPISSGTALAATHEELMQGNKLVNLARRELAILPVDHSHDAAFGQQRNGCMPVGRIEPLYTPSARTLVGANPGKQGPTDLSGQDST